jgi:TPR repeat protein
MGKGRRTGETAAPGRRRGDARAQCNLGILYGNGLDNNGHAVEANRPQAVRWLLAAAEQGLAPAQVKLAGSIRRGGGHIGQPRDRVRMVLAGVSGLHGIHRHRARSGYERIV